MQGYLWIKILTMCHSRKAGWLPKVFPVTDLVSPANCCPASPWSQSFGEWRGRLLDWHSQVGLPAVAPPRRQRSRLSAILQGGRLLPCSTYPFYLDVFGIRHHDSPSRISFPFWLHSHRPPPLPFRSSQGLPHLGPTCVPRQVNEHENLECTRAN